MSFGLICTLQFSDLLELISYSNKIWSFSTKITYLTEFQRLYSPKTHTIYVQINNTNSFSKFIVPNCFHAH